MCPKGWANSSPAAQVNSDYAQAADRGRASRSKSQPDDVSFALESVLVDRFVECLLSQATPWAVGGYVREFNFQRGRPDVIILRAGGDHIVAVEAKLTRWRDALYQASRNRCFAHESYVLLPMRAARRAEFFLSEFEWHNVGLCYLDGGVVHIVREPDPQCPVEPGLSAAGMDAVRATISGA